MVLLEKLADLVPQPLLHLLRFHGCHPIVPAKPVAEPAARCDASAPSRGHRLRRATLPARVFSSDISEYTATPVRVRRLTLAVRPAT